ncbi:SAM-dependent methyltransferase [Ornithinimicrobium cerasi]|uniref:SAM-dependent methyltransferase, MidA family n=1 Tax=Ornithinimicrobium cerasi TaxID=2248773 RepID=A0A285VRV6_9MICO|nr:SAM-dependent methyltransferase [Ornithinimicrobium cerasi]SOC56328.1 SAM-dependent methyltransferase, MidA family [Ornithinimicrobium cerasi]
MTAATTPPVRAPWRTAWQEALYGEDGFYRSSAPAEHFATSVQGVPGAGEVLAEAVLALARRHGCPAVVDVGAGRGELLGHLRRLEPALRLTGVDVVARPDGLEVDDWLVSPGGAALPPTLTGLRDTLVLAHEWLDVVPCPVAERDTDGVWRAVTVAPDGTEGRGAPLAGPDLAWADRWLGPEVLRAEVGRTRDLAWAELVRRVDLGVVVAVDYGHTRADRPHHGTLTGFRSGREVEPVPDGSCDLTAHVAVDSLQDVTVDHRPTRCHVSRQWEVLRDLLPAPTAPAPTDQPPRELARTDPSAYLAALARRGALAALTAPGGLGSFRWVVAVRG